MDKIFKKRRSQLEDFNSYLGKHKDVKTLEAPDDLFTKCPSCKAIIPTKQIEEHLFVCPECGYHFKMTAYDRMMAVFDQGKFKELYSHMHTNDPLHFPGYDKKLSKAIKATGMYDGVMVATGTILGIKSVVVVMDSHFMMASMGSVAGEKITKAIEHATKRKRPLIIFTASGGARMQEGIFSLMQMAKTTAALKRHLDAGLLYIAYLTNPTYGGVSASFALLGDINIAEEGAMIGFAGPRVIETTMKQKLPEGFQSATFLKDHGFIDMIVKRNKMRSTLSLLLHMHQEA